ncbi:Gustatory receptor 23 [Cephus cinctus]|uniref:Gustatory receptor n=1 Tax=Cephus cinctus TaxID=211228 RepID=A0A3L9LWI2_CEPCN|nr:uncharacterized protein LOC107271011 isoform X2 [Cephus cinctus]RLZ02230.1 Gustatory receptor 23 [Cephus cinctus]
MFFRRISALLYLSRIFGSVPYKITSLDLQKSKWARAYSFSLILLYIILILFAYTDFHMPPDMRVLVIILHVLKFLSLIGDILMSIAMYGDFPVIFMEMNLFDNQINYRIPNLISIYSFIYPILLVTTPILFLICTFLQSYEKNVIDLRQPSIFSYLIINTVINASSMIFVVLMESMLSRFRHLHRLVQSVGSTTLFGPGEEFSNDLGPRDIWKLYERLVATTEKINDHYSMQILFWISHASCSIICRCYIISTSALGNGRLNIITHVIGTLSQLLLVISISSVCHFTMLEANRIPVSLFSPKIWMRYHARGTMGDNSDVCMYFGLRKLKVKAGFGLVTLNLPAIILFISLTSTYLQFVLNENIE